MFRLLAVGGVVALGMVVSAAATSKNIVTECHLFELAFKVTVVQKDEAYSDILVDCPGYESWTFEMSTRASILAFKLAMEAERPEKIRDGGDRADALFERMIQRGVPVDIAQAMVETRTFDKAVASYGKY